MDIKKITKVKCPFCSKKFRPIELYQKEQTVQMVESNTEKKLPGQNKKMVDTGQVCAICGKPLELHWTVSHGDAFCIHCGIQYRKDGKRVRCTAKESIRSGLRKIWLDHKDDLESFSEGDRPDMSSEVKANVKENKSSASKTIPKNFNPGMIIKVLSKIEDRPLIDLDEDISILDALGGVLVTQKYREGGEKDPVFYSFSRMRIVAQTMLECGVDL